MNNDGFTPGAAYEHFAFDGITVNGLAIGGASRGIEDYYLAEVIRGPGAFVEYAATHDDFADAMRRKLERELRVMILGGIGAADGAATRDKVTCLGVRLSRRTRIVRLRRGSAPPAPRAALPSSSTL